MIKFDKEDELSFGDLAKASNQQLQTLLSVYAGYLIVAEQEISALEIQVKVREAAIEQQITKEINRKMADISGRAPAREHLKTSVISENNEIGKEYFIVLEAQAQLREVQGIQAAYTHAYNAVSRVISLRTHSEGK